MKVSDYVAKRLVEHGISHVFMVTGGGAMHLNHSFGMNNDLKCIFNHHEQACTIAAEAYYRVNNKLAVANVTSGPGGTNAITGVYGAFVDSIGMLVISGQVKWETTVRSTGLPLRQYGDQELDIEELVKPVTKYVCMVTDPLMIRYELEKAIYLATHGRPGPVWLDIPLNVQSAKIEPEKLIQFQPNELKIESETVLNEGLLGSVLNEISKAERPVIYAGSGIHLSAQKENLIHLTEVLGIPIVTAWNSNDLITDDSPYYAGRAGTVGDRAGNFAVQNSDLLLILGSRLNIRQVSYNWGSFARAAKKIWVDIDKIELEKPTVKPDIGIVSNLSDFIPELIKKAHVLYQKNSVHLDWVNWCIERRRKYPVVLESYYQNALVNPYVFIDKLFKQMPKNQITVTGNGSACVVSFQAAEIKAGQRLWTNSGCATMGYDLPAAIGAHMASGKDINCITGDGSIMMNLQELETIAGNNYPIKIFILNNSGYVSIFQTHRNFFNGEEVGGGPKSGVTFPKFENLAKAFALPYFKVTSHEEADKVIEKALKKSGPFIFEIIVDENIGFAPKLGAKQHPDGRITSPPLEDLSPFLSKEELVENMIVKMVDSE